MPQDAAESTEGLLLIVNGIDDPLRWDGLTSSMSPVGIVPPASAMGVGSTGTGNAVGDYYAYLRFVDADGNFSNLSNISSVFSAEGSIGVIVSQATVDGQFSFLSPNHGLVNDTIIRFLDTVGAEVPGGLTWKVSVIDKDHFALAELVGATVLHFTGNYVVQPNTIVLQPELENVNVRSPQGSFSKALGFWKSGSNITYTGVSVPVEQRVVRRQILRNTAGQTDTFYVDIDTTDLTATTFTSTRDDVDLSSQEPVALLDDKGRALANQYTTPPTNKFAIASHLGRMFAMGDKEYKEGCVSVTFGSKTVTGIGTQWPGAVNPGRPSPFALRFLWVNGAPKPFQIASVNQVAQTLTLVDNYTGPTDPYAAYAIRAGIGERRLVYYTQGGQPESWRATNAFAIQEDDDDITGGLTKGSFLYILEKRHIHRFTFQADPADDGFVFPAANRGCINQRCWVVIDDAAYMLDESGVYSFTGGQECEPLSLAIQDLFEADDSSYHPYRINWAAQEDFHAAHDPNQETIRFFVALAGSYLPYHALVYHYRSKMWWIEEYNFPVGASALGRLDGKPQLYLGSSAGKIFAFGQGHLDSATDAGTIRSTVTAATLLSLTDNTAVYPTVGVVGSPLAIVNGPGKEQTRRIVAVSGTTLTIDRPWLEMPTSESTYQIGGVNWTFRSGWFRWAEDEEEHPRRLEVVFEPIPHPAIMDARLYMDRSKTPYVWDTTYTSEAQAQFSSEHGKPDLVADLTKSLGFVQRRFDGQREFYVDGRRFVQVEIKGTANQDLLRIYGITLDGAVQ